MLVCQDRAVRELRDAAGVCDHVITCVPGQCDGSEIFISRIDGTTREDGKTAAGKGN